MTAPGVTTQCFSICNRSLKNVMKDIFNVQQHSGGMIGESSRGHLQVRKLEFVLCCLNTSVLGGIQFQTSRIVTPADTHSYANELSHKIGQLAVSIMWLTCGCCSCSRTDHLVNPLALFLQISLGCRRVSWQLSQKDCILVFSIS